jgi:hypothetical protein
MRITLLHPRPSRPAQVAALAAVAIALFSGGCAGRYVTRTEYLAPDFTRASLRGRTVAVMPATDGPAQDQGELAGVARSLHDAGARVRLIETSDIRPSAQPNAALNAQPNAPLTHPNAALTIQSNAALNARSDSRFDARPDAGSESDFDVLHVAATLPPPSATLPSPDRVALLVDFSGDPGAEAIRRDAARWGRDAGAQYLLFVRVTDGDVFRRFTPPHDAGPAVRATGRRVGLRLALVRLRDSAAVWVASGTAESWAKRSGNATTAVALSGTGGAETVDDDLTRGNLPLYPPPPAAEDLALRLTRRLLARVPLPVEIEPN